MKIPPDRRKSARSSLRLIAKKLGVRFAVGGNAHRRPVHRCRTFCSGGCDMPSHRDRRVEIFCLAAHVLGDESAAKDWMRRPAIGFDRQIPTKMIRTVGGADAVESYLLQIEHGV
jgi:uncharacterized protein (DUF2384 family)